MSIDPRVGSPLPATSQLGSKLGSRQQLGTQVGWPLGKPEMHPRRRMH